MCFAMKTRRWVVAGRCELRAHLVEEGDRAAGFMLSAAKLNPPKCCPPDQRVARSQPNEHAEHGPVLLFGCLAVRLSVADRRFISALPR
jgi:hypothetical protein